MNTYFVALLAAIIIFVPASAHAAYSFPQIHSYLQEPAYVTSASPDYTSTNYPLAPLGYFADPGNHQALCTDYAIAAGYPDTTNMYCVYEGSLHCTAFGGGDLGSGSGGTAGGSTLCIYNGTMKLYLTPPTIISTMSFANLAAQGSSPTTPSVCTNTEKYNFITGTIGLDPSSNSNISCDVYHSTGAPQTPPTASLSASPSTITAGNSSALTYSCVGGATSASIDNGVGAVSATSGTVGVTPGTTTTYTLICTNANGSGTAQATVSVSPGLPDLTAGGVSPTTATVGTPVTLTSTVSNKIGAGSTGAAFTDLFQRATDAYGTGSTDIGTYSNAILANGASNVASLSYTFPSAATWYVRVCADKSSAASTGVISESNEANNCGAWTPVSVAVAAVPSCTFTGNPTAAVPSTLTWSCVNVTSCTGGGFSTGFASPISGSASVSVAGTYTLSCTGPSGSVTNSVTVGSSCSGTPTGRLSASQTRVRQGTSVNLTLTSIANVQTSCVLSGPGVNRIYSATACSVPGDTVLTPAINTQSVYTLICDNVKVSSVVVNVLPNFTEF